MDRLMRLAETDVARFLRRGRAQDVLDLVHAHDQLQQQIDLEPQFIHPFNMVVVGHSGSGKTYFVAQLIKSGMIKPPPDSIHLFTGIKDSSGDLLQALEELQEQEDIPFHHYGDDLDQVDEVLNEEGQKLLIIDDLMQQVVENKKMVELFVSGTHHKNASAIMMWQDLFPQGKAKRSVTLARNAHYHVIFYSPNVSAFKQFSSRRDGGDELMRLYRQLPQYKKTPLIIDSEKNRAWIGLEPTHIVNL